MKPKQTTMTRQRAEGDPPAEPALPAAGEGEETPPPSSKPLPKCECGASYGPAAKFCAECGNKLSAESDEEEEEPSPDAPAAPPEPAAHVALPPRKPADASFAGILGLPESASLPAQRTAAIDMRQVFDHAAALTGQRSAAGILGGLTALADDASASGRLRAERDELRARGEREERHRLAHRLVALGVAGHERGKVFLDSVDESGARVLDRAGNPVQKLAPVYAEMKLATMRGLVEGYERNAPKRDPFEPAADLAAKASPGAMTVHVLAERIELAKKHPRVIEMAGRPGQTLSIDKLAAAFVAQDFDL